jgi:hypothetical protein
MGAFIICDIKFKKEKDRVKFEDRFIVKDKNIIVDEQSDSLGFAAWTMLRNPLLNPIYSLGFMGYEDVNGLLKECKRRKIDITFFAYIPINDKNAHWVKLKGKW